MSNFREILREGSRKNSAFKNMNIFYISLKHVIWKFRICTNFCEISKFRHFINTLGNFSKSVLLIFPRNLNISPKIYLNGISRSCANICSYFKSLNFFWSFSEAFAEHFAKIAHKVAKSKYFVHIKNESDSSSFSNDI